MMKLRKYQLEAVEAVYKEWRAGNRKTLIVAATGTGKTVIFSEVANREVGAGHRVLILAHRGELLDQASDKILANIGLETALEKADSSCAHSDNRIVVASIQTLSRNNRLNQFSPNYFQTIIVDEAHHSTADTYQKVLKYFSKANVLGVTATPDRSDKRNLSNFFDSIAYSYPMMTAVKDGYLCPIKTRTIQIEMDLREVKTSQGDYQLGDLDSTIEPYLYEIAHEMTKYCKDRKTVVFLPLVETAQKFKNILNEIGFKAVEVNGKSIDREEILNDFDEGKYDVLTNCMLVTEGWDCPSVDCAIILRPTKSESLYIQMVGRIMRLFEGKENALLLDFLWLTKEYDLCRPSCLVESDVEIAQKMNDLLAESGDEMSLEDAQNIATDSVMQDREKALRDRLKDPKSYVTNPVAGFDRKYINPKNGVDPISYALSIYDNELASYKPKYKSETKAPTEKQLKYIAKCGVDIMTVDSFGYASLLISKLIERMQGGYATPKQIRCLEGLGFSRVGRWSFADANRTISAVSKTNWKVSERVNTKEYSEKMIARMSK